MLTDKFNKFSRCSCGNTTTTTTTTDQTKHSNTCSSRKPIKKIKNNSDSSTSISSSSSSSDNESEFSSNNSDISDTNSLNSNSSSESDKNSSFGSNKSGKKIKKTKRGLDDIRSIEIKRKRKHPERLHPDLCFNEPDQTNDGPLCKCKLKNTSFGIRHQIYFGEKPIEPVCDQLSNNSNKLYHYRMNIRPFSYFMQKNPTKIEYDNHEYVFEGYSIFTHEELGNIPDSVVVIHSQECTLNIVKEDMIENFTIGELNLLKKFIFVEILELYDLKWKCGGNENRNVSDEIQCDCIHIMPRFCRQLPCN
jgi:ribonuclease III